MFKGIAIATAAAAMLVLAGCEGSAEKTGENLDSSMEEATQGHENLGDGPLEQTGEAIDEASGKQRDNDAADAIHDATDDNPNTNP